MARTRRRAGYRNRRMAREDKPARKQTARKRRRQEQQAIRHERTELLPPDLGTCGWLTW